MNWIGLLIAFALVSSAALAASFLARWQGSAEKPSSAASRFLSCLPGYDCSFCGHGTCREYAEAIDTQAADPVLCAPGGVKTEDAIRALLAKRPCDARSVKRRAVIRCGGTKGVAALAFDYDNREDCVSAAALYGGPKACKNGCLGFGTCVAACPLNAIYIHNGCACIDADRCSGCGICTNSCPKGLIDLLPADQTWFVACSALMEPERRAAACTAACDACGECARRSMMGEFVIVDRIARVAHVEPAAGAEIASHCHARAIRPIGSKEKGGTPFEKPKPGV